MVEQICPRCDEGNPLDNVYCGQCGARLKDQPLARRGGELTVGAGRLLPLRPMQQVGRAVAVSLVTLAAEAGLSWLRRRLEQVDTTGGDDKAARLEVDRQRPRITILSRRVLRVWQQGRLVSQAVEESVWQIEE